MEQVIPFGAEDRRRARRALMTLAVVLGAAAVVQLVNAWLRQDPSTLVHGAFTALGAGVVLVAMKQLTSGSVARAIFWAGVTLLALLGVLLSELVPMLQRMVGRTVTLHFARPLRPIVVTIDRSQFEQIVLNLIVNARDAMQSGGNVYVTLDATREGVAFTVRDTGVMVTDVIMPGVSGRVLAERAVELRPGLRVLFVSGYSTDAELAAKVRDGLAHFLSKPFTRIELEAALARVVESTAPRLEAPRLH